MHPVPVLVPCTWVLEERGALIALVDWDIEQLFSEDHSFTATWLQLPEVLCHTFDTLAFLKLALIDLAAFEGAALDTDKLFHSDWYGKPPHDFCLDEDKRFLCQVIQQPSSLSGASFFDLKPTIRDCSISGASLSSNGIKP